MVFDLKSLVSILGFVVDSSIIDLVSVVDFHSSSIGFGLFVIGHLELSIEL
jgi:hypothetical protein